MKINNCLDEEDRTKLMDYMCEYHPSQSVQLINIGVDWTKYPNLLIKLLKDYNLIALIDCLPADSLHLILEHLSSQ